MQGPGVPSLDQLTLFPTVVEAGSFAAAGRGLGRATSAVSYAITNLEQQLGVQLFDRDQARRPALTEAAAVLSAARSVSVGVDNLRAKVKGLLDGLEAQIALAVDVGSSAGPSVVRGWIETTAGVGFRRVRRVNIPMSCRFPAGAGRPPRRFGCSQRSPSRVGRRSAAAPRAASQ
jgi:hypothetical protein